MPAIIALPCRQKLTQNIIAVDEPSEYRFGRAADLPALSDPPFLITLSERIAHAPPVPNTLAALLHGGVAQREHRVQFRLGLGSGSLGAATAIGVTSITFCRSCSSSSSSLAKMNADHEIGPSQEIPCFERKARAIGDGALSAARARRLPPTNISRPLPVTSRARRRSSGPQLYMEPSVHHL